MTFGFESGIKQLKVPPKRNKSLLFYIQQPSKQYTYSAEPHSAFFSSVKQHSLSVASRVSSSTAYALIAHVQVC
jgi:hypothetical protein